MKTAEVVKKMMDSMKEAILDEIHFLGETSIEVDKAHLIQVLHYLKNSSEANYEVLMDLTGVDYLSPTKRTKVVYWLHNPSTLERIRVFLFVERDDSIPSVVSLWEGADWYERELYDLFGIRFDNHPDLKRILMPDDWHGHPLRKDYALTEIPVQFKHGVKPKVPSEIITNDRKNSGYRV